MDNNHSIDTPNWAIALEPIADTTARIILTGILAYHFQDEEAVGYGELSRWTGKSKKTICGWLRKLEELGFLIRKRQRSKLGYDYEIGPSLEPYAELAGKYLSERIRPDASTENLK